VRSLFARENRLGVLVALPFATFVTLFLIYPTLVVLYKSVMPHGSFSTSALVEAVSGTYRTGFVNSISLSFWSALIGGVIGVFLALTMKSLSRPKWLHPTLDAWSAVASQLGGIGLAFAFIATIGAQGAITKVFMNFGVDLKSMGVSTTGFWGLVVVYLYFQIPLMFLVMMPAVNGLKSSWREAAAIMGASGPRYWRAVGIPILAPSTLGGILLLFVNAFTAYATAYVLNSSYALVPLQIRFLLQGNVITGKEDLGNAIVTWVILLLLSSLLLMTFLQRRTLKWMSS
jgi:putative spermidine/putrescine transport system permease protein